jgi:hypothetical protein
MLVWFGKKYDLCEKCLTARQTLQPSHSSPPLAAHQNRAQSKKLIIDGLGHHKVSMTLNI